MHPCELVKFVVIHGVLLHRWTYAGNRRDDCTYDANGNLTASGDGWTVTYNLLNLPASAVKNAGTDDEQTVEWSYLADGTKIAAYVSPCVDVAVDTVAVESIRPAPRGRVLGLREGEGEPVADSTEVVGGRVGYLYTGSFRINWDDSSGPQLESVASVGGRFVMATDPSNSSFTAQQRYYITDHLGSTRVVLDKVGSVLERYDYYPYGEIIPATVATSGNTDYLYTGKESQNALFGINWYDSAARFQTTDGIFTSLDPLAEKYYHLSPYAYCAGNPVNVLDPDGEAAHVFVGAFVGAMIEGGIAIYHGKSAREVAGAAVRGAIEGGVIAATLGVSAGASLATVAIKETAKIVAKDAAKSALASAVGSMAEQLIADQSVDTKEVAKAAGIGAATGLVGAALNVGTNAASATVEKTIEKKYASSTVKDTYRNEIKHELRSEGKQVKGSTLNKKVEERVKTNCEAEKSFVGFLRGVGSYSVQKTSNSVVEEVITY